MIGYLNDIGPAEAWKLLAEERESVLIDVRTFAEWSYVGIPDLSNLGKKPILLEWQSYPNNELNPDFTKDLVTKRELIPIIMAKIKSQNFQVFLRVYISFILLIVPFYKYICFFFFLYFNTMTVLI